jgi:hypothetical protein
MSRNIANTTCAPGEGELNSSLHCLLAQGWRLGRSQRPDLPHPSTKVIAGCRPDAISTEVEMGVGIDQARQKQHFRHLNEFCARHAADLLGRPSGKDLVAFHQNSPWAGRHSGGINHASGEDHATIVGKFSTGSTHVRELLQPAAPSIDTLTLPRLALANDMA